MEMRDDVLSRVGAQDVDTSGNQVYGLEDTEFHWEDSDLNMDAVLRPSIDFPFSPSTFINFEMSLLTENPIGVDQEQDKDNSPPPLPTTPVSERSTQNFFVDETSPFWNKNWDCSLFCF